MKLIPVLALTLGVALLLSTLSNASVSYALDSSIKVYAKEKQGMIMLIVKNGRNANIQQLALTSLDGNVDSATSIGWKVTRDSSNKITVSSTNPIPPNGREVFMIKTDNINSIISWIAKDRNGSIVAMDHARTVIKHTVINPTGSELAYIANARSVTVTTDKVIYNKSDKMFISGALEPNSKITITIYTPSGQKVLMGQKTDVTGNFKALHVLSNAESGTYILRVSEATASAETTFRVL